jgi:hypothetical protein
MVPAYRPPLWVEAFNIASTHINGGAPGGASEIFNIKGRGCEGGPMVRK